MLKMLRSDLLLNLVEQISFIVCVNIVYRMDYFPAGVCLFEVSNKNTGTKCGICSKCDDVTLFWCLCCYI